MNPELKNLLFSLIPEDGSSRGNIQLSWAFLEAARQRGHQIEDEEYWSLRDELIQEGLIEVGRGRGGSVHRILYEVAEETPATSVVEYTNERDLYPSVEKALCQYFTKNYRFDTFISEITAQQGRRDTGGKWTRPDVSMISLSVYDYLPGKMIDVVTFEVKPRGFVDVDAVYEAAAHHSFAHRSYLVLHMGDGAQVPARIESECERLGLGLITFLNPDDWTTYEVEVKAKHWAPDPYDVNLFINQQFSDDNKRKLRAWLR